MSALSTVEVKDKVRIEVYHHYSWMTTKQMDQADKDIIGGNGVRQAADNKVLEQIVRCVG
ncbi:hypothetical protein FACS189472_10290 [Alphaproteobacteria bacterium]|nr:hypothetical protein FACS189472_10290 [Alphaproteobacteria bacterium]